MMGEKQNKKQNKTKTTAKSKKKKTKQTQTIKEKAKYILPGIVGNRKQAVVYRREISG